MTTIAAKIRKKRLNLIIRKERLVYESRITDIQGYQLAKFNKLWVGIHQSIPYYRDLVHSGIVPATINTWDDFATFPILTRVSLQNNVTSYIDPSQNVTGWSLTGGSTGTPIRVPYRSSEKQLLMPNTWLGREFYGIEISDTMFHFWGHSHLFGSGWKRYIKQIERKIKDQLLGFKTLSAYHLTPHRLREVGQAIIKMRPDYIIGYSRSLTLLARENVDKAEEFKRLPLKAIIATSEAFTDPGDAKMVEQVFDCRVGMEYGAVETGVMSYTHPADGRYRVFWDTYLLEAIPVNETDAQLFVTALYPRAMPLIRYSIGDSVRNYEGAGHSIVSFEAILGRDNDLIEVQQGSFVHSVALIHCVQAQQGVLGVQVIEEKDKSISFDIMCKKPLSEENEAIIRRNLSTLDPTLAECRINYVDQLEQTIAGKTKWIIKR